jgi:transglutaminase-like putative cysteine protease
MGERMNTPAGVSARVALASLSVVAAWSLARCFPGAGEVVPALGAVVAAELTILAATVVAPQRRFAGISLAVLGPLLVTMVPIWIVAGGATTWGWPTFATWHLIGTDLSRSWQVFNALRSPVPELPGFSLVGAWAVGGAALLAGWAADGGDTPLWVAAPPSAIFLFTSALGTAGWRPLAITAEVAALGWYATASRAARREHTVRIATRSEDGGVVRGRRSLGLAVPGTGLVVIAALLAGLVGPHFPGAQSAALVSLRSSSGASVATGEVVGKPAGQIAINTLVQVAEEEIYQSKAVFFVISSPAPTYTILTTLDTFDGDRWTSSETSIPFNSELPLITKPLAGPQRTDGGREALFESQIQVDQLGGYDVPAPSVPQAAAGQSTLTYDKPYATLSSNFSLDSQMTFDIESEVPLLPPSDAPATPGPLPAGVAGDTALPAGIPDPIVQLAHTIVRGATTDYQKAIDIENYFQSGAFTYNLPQALPGSKTVVTGGEGLLDLEKFLFNTKSGFCQQYASAFAVLARIDGLPSRIAVGFTAGTPIVIGSDQVTGSDVHAWPQVYLGGIFGWWSFEPTPGSSIPSPPLPVVGGNSQPGAKTGTTTPLTRPRGQTSPIKNGSGAKTPATLPAQLGSHAPSIDGALVWEVIGAVLLLVFSAAPLARVVRRRRLRAGSERVVHAWREAVTALQLVGLYQHDGETYTELVQRTVSAAALPEEVCNDLARLAQLTTVAAYAPTEPPAESVREAVAVSRDVRASARRRVSTWRRSWATVDPRGVLTAFSR